jgi:hypothetical protein
MRQPFLNKIPGQTSRCSGLLPRAVRKAIIFGIAEADLVSADRAAWIVSPGSLAQICYQE